MNPLLEKYRAWAKYPEKYTAQEVLNQIVADLEWLDEENSKKTIAPKFCHAPFEIYHPCINSSKRIWVEKRCTDCEYCK